jgi:hypothetical protein
MGFKLFPQNSSKLFSLIFHAVVTVVFLCSINECFSQTKAFAFTQATKIEGNALWVDIESIQADSYPPKTVTLESFVSPNDRMKMKFFCKLPGKFNLFDGQQNKWGQYTYQDTSPFAMLHYWGCGVDLPGAKNVFSGLWFPVTVRVDEIIALTFPDEFQKVGPIKSADGTEMKNAIKVHTIHANYSNIFDILGRSSFYIDCESDFMIANDMKESLALSVDSIGAVLRDYFACSGRFPVKTSNDNSSLPKKELNDPFEKAKQQCEELGFSPKTEKFGQCVLKLME